MATTNARIAKTTKMLIALIKDTENPNGRQKLTKPFLVKIKRVIKIMLETIKTVVLSVKSPLQSAKCEAPSGEKLKTPALNSVFGKVK